MNQIKNIAAIAHSLAEADIDQVNWESDVDIFVLQGCRVVGRLSQDFRLVHDSP